MIQFNLKNLFLSIMISLKKVPICNEKGSFFSLKLNGQ